MTRRWPDFRYPAPEPFTLRDWALVFTGSLIVLVAFLAIILMSLAAVPRAHAHDIWINKGSYRNPAGEWCCGAEDCGVVSPNAVTAKRGGYSVVGVVTYGEAITGNKADGPTVHDSVNEVIPYSQVQPSPDGAYWRCKRPDGTPRCFFAPPPGS